MKKINKLTLAILCSFPLYIVQGDYLLKSPIIKGIELNNNFTYEFSSHTFTNCGRNGNQGPTLEECKSAYNTNWDESPAKFNIETNGYQLWTVPATGYYKITAAGAKGGKGANSTSVRGMGYEGGYGALMSGDFHLTAGTKLNIVVGQMGIDGIGNYNCGGGGGGGSFVWIENESVPLIVAGGGGGGPGSNWSISSSIHGTTAINPTKPYGSSSAPGINGYGSSIYNTGVYSGGTGAGWYSNGALGSSRISISYSKSNGFIGGIAPNNLTNGGFGGGGAAGDDGRSNYSHGTGGGGGYSGGSGNYYQGHGGGAGSFNSGTNQSNSTGVNSSHGYVTITKL